MRQERKTHRRASEESITPKTGLKTSSKARRSACLQKLEPNGLGKDQQMMCLTYNLISLHSPSQLRAGLNLNTPKQTIPLIDQLKPIDLLKLTMLVLLVPDDIATFAEIVVFAFLAVVSFVPDWVGGAHVALVIVEDVLVFGVGFMEWMD